MKNNRCYHRRSCRWRCFANSDCSDIGSCQVNMRHHDTNVIGRAGGGAEGFASS